MCIKFLFSYDTGDFDVENQFYIRSYTRFQPYLVGMGLAFIMFKIRGKEVKIHWVSQTWQSLYACMYVHT